jgi:hypothetical protein
MKLWQSATINRRNSVTKTTLIEEKPDFETLKALAEDADALRHLVTSLADGADTVQRASDLYDATYEFALKVREICCICDLKP